MNFDAVTSSHPKIYHCNWKCPFDNDLLISKFEQSGWTSLGVHNLSSGSLNELLLKDSNADLLIFSALDQHNPDNFIFGKTEATLIRDRYKYIIFNSVEPYYSTLSSFSLDEHEKDDHLRRLKHESFCYNLSPDLVIYNCKIDTEKSPFNSIYVSNGDVDLRSSSPKPWEQREDALVFNGRENIRNNIYRNSRGELINSRRHNITFIQSVAQEIDFKYRNVDDLKSLKDLYNLACGYKFEIQPRCGYHLHGLRAMTAMLCGSIPIIFKQTNELYDYYNDILIDSETCFIVEDLKPSDKEKLIKKIADKRLCSYISKRIVKVAEDYCDEYNLKKAAEYFI